MSVQIMPTKQGMQDVDRSTFAEVDAMLAEDIQSKRSALGSQGIDTSMLSDAEVMGADMPEQMQMKGAMSDQERAMMQQPQAQMGQVQQMKGAMSDKEMDMLRNIMGSSANDPSTQAMIRDIMEVMGSTGASMAEAINILRASGAERSPQEVRPGSFGQSQQPIR